MPSAYPAPEDVFGVSTVPDALDRSASSGRGVVLVDRNLNSQEMSYRELADGAGRVAGGLRRLGVEPGDRVCLLSPTSADLLVCLFGTWRAGAVPVVLPLPRRLNDLESYLEDVTVRVQASQASALVVADIFAEQGITLDVDVSIVQPRELLDAEPLSGPSGAGADDLGLLQFTSGTTARSRAVMLTHRQILTNISCAGTMLDIHRDRDVVVSWLPLFHDMGLIGLVVGAVAYGIPLVLQPTEEFLGRPGSWLEAISRYRGTLTASPNFGYGLAARDIASKPRPLDLSTWRIAANGAEPVDPDTVSNFVTETSRYGFKETSMCPMFGLAEATLAVTLSRPDEPVVVEWLAREPLETQGIAVASTADDPAAKPLVACGHPLPGTEVAIVDSNGEALAAGQVGEICVRSPSLMSGYWHDDERTRQSLADGWLRTGDLGVMTDGGLAVCGRVKDMIILGGRNLYPEDYEFWTERVPGIRRGNVIAFSIPERERMVVVAETSLPADEAEHAARQTLLTLRKRLPRGPEEVVLIQPGTLPKTSSGKRQRGACRDGYASGTLAVVAVAHR